MPLETISNLINTLPPETLLYLKLFGVLITIGAIGGFLSGLLGIGGGIIFVPALFFCFKSIGVGDSSIMHIAVGTSLVVTLATVSTSAFHHNKRGGVDLKVVRSWAPFIITGVIIGSFFASMINGETLKKFFAGMMIVLACYMALSKERPRKEHHKVPKFILHSYAFIVGIISSMLGISGSVLNIPMMTYAGMPIQRAIGTGATLGLAVGIPGTISYVISGLSYTGNLPPFSIGYVNLIAIAALIPMSMLIAPFGVKASHSLPRPLLRQLFAVLVAIISIRMLLTL